MPGDDTRGLELPRRSVLAGLGTVGLGSAAAGMGTGALFSDTESFEDNSLTAGTLNLILSGYVAATNSEAIQIDGNADADNPSISDTTEASAVFSLSDVKPGDLAIPCLGFEIEGNPAYVQLAGTSVSVENSVTEPESTADDEDNTSSSTTGGSGELSSNLDIQAFGPVGATEVDETDVDSIESDLSGESLDALGGDSAFASGSETTVGSAFGQSETSYTLADGSGNVQEYQPGRYAIYLFLSVDSSVGNIIQSDSLTLDLTVRIQQSRHNDDPFSS